MVLCK